jgi:hypothetical protein
MDYRSFAPGAPTKPLMPKPDLSLPELPAPRNSFSHKFFGIVLIIIALFGATAYSIWYWTQNQPDQTLVPTFTPRGPSVEVGKVPLPDMALVKETQDGFDAGHQPWRGDPRSVACTVICLGAGVAGQPDPATLLQEIYVSAENSPIIYRGIWDGKPYEVTVVQPVIGPGKVWFVSDVEYAPTDWKTYRNNEYGFGLTLTDAWKNYEVIQSGGSQGVGDPRYFQFSMPTSDKTKHVSTMNVDVKSYSDIFAITIYRKDIWDQMPKDQKAGYQILGQNSQFVYTYYPSSSIAGELPSDLKNINFEISKILSTFKFTK